MSTDSLDISLPEVSNTAVAIRSCNGNIQDNLGNIKTQMNQLVNSWSSPAGESIRNRFNELDETFANHYEKISNYATFLDTTVDAYTDMEQQLTNSADSFS